MEGIDCISLLFEFFWQRMGKQVVIEHINVLFVCNRCGKSGVDCKFRVERGASAGVDGVMIRKINGMFF